MAANARRSRERARQIAMRPKIEGWGTEARAASDEDWTKDGMISVSCLSGGLKVTNLGDNVVMPPRRQASLQAL